MTSTVAARFRATFGRIWLAFISVVALAGAAHTYVLLALLISSPRMNPG